MQAPYRESSESLRMRADALEIENVILRSRIKRLENKGKQRDRRVLVRFLTQAMVVVFVILFAAAILSACVSVVGAAAWQGVGLQ
jgi:hypothetical protein